MQEKPFQYSLRKLFLITVILACVLGFLKLIAPFVGLIGVILLAYATVPLTFMLRGWILESQGEQERGSDYVSIGILLLLFIGPVLLIGCAITIMLLAGP